MPKLNTQIILEALRLYREANHGGPLDNERIRRLVDEQIDILRTPVTKEGLLREGGAWLAEVREHILWNSFNGSDVTWGSDDEVRFTRPLSVHDLEYLAAKIAAKALTEFKG